MLVPFLCLALLLESAVLAGPFEEECSLWNTSAVPVATTPSDQLQELTSTTVEAGKRRSS